ncbi:MAG: hypothetical protein LBR26_05100, partial [Prevotella sp.]|nr:hypothetical protein [Prevotella sp.]
DPKNKFKHLIETKIDSDYETANRIIESCGAEIRSGGNEAYYSFDENYIRVPLAMQFEHEEAHWATLFHELGHWGDKNVLDTKMTGNKNTPEYAYGELVAELTACFLCRSCNIPNNFERHESYIAYWIKAMKNDTTYIWRASRDASKIADHFLKQAGIVQDVVQEDEKDVTV